MSTLSPEKQVSSHSLKLAAIRLWRFAGSLTWSIVLMLLLLILTFCGTLHLVRLAPEIGLESAVASFFCAPYVWIPLGGEQALVSLPLPGMGITCFLLFVNLLIGGVLRIRWNLRHAGVLVAHAGILLLLASVMLGNLMTRSVDSVELPVGVTVREKELPFVIRLDRFTPEFYPGTAKPKSYESRITLDSEHGSVSQSVIRMNEPLRYDGWTLYQMSWGRASDGKMVSILRATHNPWEQGPKWASYVIAVGLAWHFIGLFVGYLRKRSRSSQDVSSVSDSVAEEILETQCSPQSHMKRWGVIGAVIGVVALFVVAAVLNRSPERLVELSSYESWSPEFTERVSAMAVLDGGRAKPVSTYAGFRLLRTLGKRSFAISVHGRKVTLTPTEWMLDCLFRPEWAEQFPVFLVNRENVTRSLGLPAQDGKRKKYSYVQLMACEQKLNEAMSLIRRMPENELTDDQKEILGLYRSLESITYWMMYGRLLTEAPAMLSQADVPAWFPNENGETAWGVRPDSGRGAMLAMASLLVRRAIDEPTTSRADYQKKAESVLTEQLVLPNELASSSIRSALDRELLYYRIDPLYPAFGIFAAAFVCLLVCSLWQWGRKRERVARFLRPGGMSPGWILGALGVAVLLGSLVLRSFITMRSPVGNTFETIAFVSCMGVMMALIGEYFSKKGIVLAAGLILGMFACQMGMMYEASRAVDHMDPLVAVLRSNFLLSTHVLTIVLGYAGGLLAAVLGHVRLLASPLHLLSEDTERSLDRMAYGILCFSLMFVLIGTVFGGIWGNESWGRFWGWDPKENGALMIVLWQLVLLHTRKAGMLTPWRLHFGNVLGGLIIAFAWWGVNMLGVGLHSYGFSSGQGALEWFYGVEVILCVLMVVLRKRTYPGIGI